MSTNEAKVKFSGDASDLKRASAEAKGAITDVGKAASVHGRMLSGLKQAGLQAAAGIAAATGATALFTAALQKMGDVSDIAASTGLSPETIQRLGNAAKQSGASMESIAAAVSKFAKVLYGDGGSAAEVLKQLGLSVDDLKQLSPDALFERVGVAISSIENPTQRVAVAMQLFGKNGRSLLPLFDEMSEGIADVGIASADVVEDVDAMGDAMEAFQNRAITGAAQILSAIKPVVDWVVKALETVSAQIGVNIHQAGELVAALGRSWELVKQGKYSEAVSAFAADAKKSQEVQNETMAKLMSEIWSDTPANKKRGPLGVALDGEDSDSGGGGGGKRNSRTSKQLREIDDKIHGRGDARHKATKDAAREHGRAQKEIAGNEAAALETRRNTQLNGMSDEDRLAELIRERDYLDKKRAVGNEGQSELDRSEAEKKYYEVAGKVTDLQRQIESKNQVSRGGGGGGSSGGGGNSLPIQGPPPVDNNLTKEEREYQAYVDANAKDGRLPNSGIARMMERRAQKSRRRVDNWNRRGIGGPASVSTQGGTGAAARQADINFGRFSGPRPGDPDFVGPLATPAPGDPGFVGPLSSMQQDAQKRKQQAQEMAKMQKQEASKSREQALSGGKSGGGSDADASLASIAQDVRQLKEDVSSRLPKAKTS